MRGILLIVFLVFTSTVWAGVAPAVAYAPEANAWVGQRLSFYIDLRARGSFAGAASFDLPQLPRTLLMKIGEPVVGSQQIDGETWFVQTHEFALFSQEPGPLEVPPVTARFARREGFTGPASDVQAETSAFSVDIRRPPGSEDVGFLITTESLDIIERWDPAPGPSEVGAVFKRTIVQHAAQLPGMALMPAPDATPGGVRAYPGAAATNDRLARGEFLGERSETITYLLQKPGALELPAIRYVWWDPVAEKLQSKPLPAVIVEVAEPPAGAAEEPTFGRRAWPWLLAAVLIIGVGGWQRRILAAWARRFWRGMNPPDRAAARKLLGACRDNDAVRAGLAWAKWLGTREDRFRPDPELGAAVLELQRYLFGPEHPAGWRGTELARAFQHHLATARKHETRTTISALPSLNPGC